MKKSNIFITFIYEVQRTDTITKKGWLVCDTSHMIMEHPNEEGTITVPYHGANEVKKGLLNAILKQAKVKTTKR